MNKPLLVVITGRPASGKSTLAHILAKEIKCPLVSRDELKEGYINTTGLHHNELNNSSALHVYDTFFKVIDLLTSKGISIIAEAAFQDKLWKPKLLNLSGKAKIKIIICKTSSHLTKARFNERLLKEPDREKFHGDNLVKENGGLLTNSYDAPNINAPTLEVDTTDGYNPQIEEITSFIKQRNNP
jgi:predicted kinase